MKRQGESEANPRFHQLTTQLTAIQRAQVIKSQQAMQLQQHQQQQQQHQQQQPQHQQHQQPQVLPAPQVQQPPRPVEGQQSSPVMNMPLRLQENGPVNGMILGYSR